MKKTIIALGAVLSSMMLLSACGNQDSQQASHHHVNTKRVMRANDHKKMKMSANSMPTVKPDTSMPMTVNYKKPSEPKAYPKTLDAKNDRIYVSIKQQRAYIQKKSGKQWKTIYGMYVSTGSHNRTPRGTYHIDGVKTKWFYSAPEKEGAEYGTGWKDGGVYLFHSTPANQKHQIFQKIAKQLGKKPTSHGCVHLTIPDAKYIYYHAPQGMPVIIK